MKNKTIAWPLWLLIGWYSLLAAGAVGYVMNIFEIFSYDYEEAGFSLIIAARLVGVVMYPVGSIVGYL